VTGGGVLLKKAAILPPVVNNVGKRRPGALDVAVIAPKVLWRRMKRETERFELMSRGACASHSEGRVVRMSTKKEKAAL
jgi:hypothetical protein